MDHGFPGGILLLERGAAPVAPTAPGRVTAADDVPDRVADVPYATHPRALLRSPALLMVVNLSLLAAYYRLGVVASTRPDVRGFPVQRAGTLLLDVLVLAVVAVWTRPPVGDRRPVTDRIALVAAVVVVVVSVPVITVSGGHGRSTTLGTAYLLLAVAAAASVVAEAVRHRRGAPVPAAHEWTTA